MDTMRETRRDTLRATLRATIRDTRRDTLRATRRDTLTKGYCTGLFKGCQCLLGFRGYLRQKILMIYMGGDLPES